LYTSGASVFLNEYATTIIATNLPPSDADKTILSLRLPHVSKPWGFTPTVKEKPTMPVVMPTSIVAFLKTPVVYMDRCRVQVSFQVLPAQRLPSDLSFHNFHVSQFNKTSKCTEFIVNTGIGLCTIDTTKCNTLFSNPKHPTVIEVMMDYPNHPLKSNNMTLQVQERNAVVQSESVILIQSLPVPHKRGEPWKVTLVGNSTKVGPGEAFSTLYVNLTYNTTLVEIQSVVCEQIFDTGNVNLEQVGTVNIHRFAQSVDGVEGSQKYCTLTFLVHAEAPIGKKSDAITSVMVSVAKANGYELDNVSVQFETPYIWVEDTETLLGMHAFVESSSGPGVYLVVHPGKPSPQQLKLNAYVVRRGYRTANEMVIKENAVNTPPHECTALVSSVTVDPDMQCTIKGVFPAKSAQVQISWKSMTAVAHVMVYAPVSIRLVLDNPLLKKTCDSYEHTRLRRMVQFSNGDIISDEIDVTTSLYHFAVESTSNVVQIVDNAIVWGIDVGVSTIKCPVMWVGITCIPVDVTVSSDISLQSSIVFVSHTGLRWPQIQPIPTVVDKSPLQLEGDNHTLTPFSMPSGMFHLTEGSLPPLITNFPSIYEVKRVDSHSNTYNGTVLAGSLGQKILDNTVMVQPSSDTEQCNIPAFEIKVAPAYITDAWLTTHDNVLVLSAGSDDSSKSFYSTSKQVQVWVQMSNEEVIDVTLHPGTVFQNGTMSLDDDQMPSITKSNGNVLLNAPKQSNRNDSSFQLYASVFYQAMWTNKTKNWNGMVRLVTGTSLVAKANAQRQSASTLDYNHIAKINGLNIYPPVLFNTQLITSDGKVWDIPSNSNLLGYTLPSRWTSSTQNNAIVPLEAPNQIYTVEASFSYMNVDFFINVTGDVWITELTPSILVSSQIGVPTSLEFQATLSDNSVITNLANGFPGYTSVVDLLTVHSSHEQDIGTSTDSWDYQVLKLTTTEVTLDYSTPGPNTITRSVKVYPNHKIINKKLKGNADVGFGDGNFGIRPFLPSISQETTIPVRMYITSKIKSLEITVTFGPNIVVESCAFPATIRNQFTEVDCNIENSIVILAMIWLGDTPITLGSGQTSLVANIIVSSSSSTIFTSTISANFKSISDISYDIIGNATCGVVNVPLLPIAQQRRRTFVPARRDGRLTCSQSKEILGNANKDEYGFDMQDVMYLMSYVICNTPSTL
jgi:hypothetical protein